MGITKKRVHMSKIILLLFFIGQLQALEIYNPQWGLDGTIKLNSFNTISFDIRNDEPIIFDDYISISESSYAKGLVTRHKLFLNKGQKKTIQLSCYIQNNYNDWFLNWPGGKVKINRPKIISDGANIYLSEDTSQRTLPRGLKRLNEELFPATVSLTTNLNSIVLDHNPDWSPLQRTAFMDWLKKGGRLYVLQGRTQDYPVFTSLMSELNFDGQQKYFNNGLVSRQAKTILNFRMPSANKNSSGQNNNSYDTDYIIQGLREIVKTEHNWGLIYFLIFCYLALIGPLNYIVGRRTRDWKIPNLFFLLTVIAFSVLFSIIGRRGYGEETKLSSFSFADHIDENNYDVKQWTDIFVTSGDTYSVSHQGGINLYHAPSEGNNLSAISDSETNSFTADIPLFSSRSLILQTTLPGHQINAEITKMGKTAHTSIKVVTKAKIKDLWVIRKGNVYTTQKVGDQYTTSSPLDDQNYFYSPDPYEQIVHSFLSSMVSHNQNFQTPFKDTTLNEDLIQVIVMVKSPESFHFKGGNINGKEEGWTLYRLKLNRKKVN